MSASMPQVLKLSVSVIMIRTRSQILWGGGTGRGGGSFLTHYHRDGNQVTEKTIPMEAAWSWIGRYLVCKGDERHLDGTTPPRVQRCTRYRKDRGKLDRNHNYAQYKATIINH